MADSKAKDDASTLSFRPGRPAGGGGGSKLVVLESEGKDSPRGADGPSLQPQWLKSPSGKDLGRGPAGPPGYPGGHKPRWGKDPPPNRPPFGKEIEWHKPGGGGADWDPEGEANPNRAPDNRWRDEEREGGGQARAANGFRDRWQVDKGGEANNKWGAADGGGEHRRERWGGDAGGENRKWGPNRWDADRDKEAPPRNKWGPEPEGGAPPGPRAPPEDNGFRRGNDPWRPSGRGRGGVDPPPTGFAIPPGGFARGRGRGRAPGFGGMPEQRPPIGAPPGEAWNHHTPAPAGGVVSERERVHRYSKVDMLEVLKKVRGGAGLKKPDTSADVQEIVLKECEEPFALIPLDEEDKSYYESIRKGEPTRPPPRPTDAVTPPQKDPAGRGRGLPRAGAPGDDKAGAEDSFFDAPAMSAQRGVTTAVTPEMLKLAEARFEEAQRERNAQPAKDSHLWRRNEAPAARKEEEPVAKDDTAKGAKLADDVAAKDWRSNRFGEGDRAWRKPNEEKPAEKKIAPLTPPPPKAEEAAHRADQVSSWRRGDENKKPATPEKEAVSPFAAHLLPDDLLGGKDDPAAELWEGGEHENDEAYTEGGVEPPAEFWYKDPQGETQGPFAQEDIEQWLEQGFFTADLPVRRSTLPESAPFVPLGTALPHLKPKPPRMPPGYEQKELEDGRDNQREAVLERVSRPGTGPEAAREGAAADGRLQRTLHEAAVPQAASWPQNHVTQPHEAPKPQTPEQTHHQLRHPSLRTEAPASEAQPPSTEPPFPSHFPGAPDLSFLHSEEPRKSQTTLDQFPPQHPLFRGAPQRPAEQPPAAEQPPFFSHPAFARGQGPLPNWPPHQEQFSQPAEVSELPPWLVGAQERTRKGEQLAMPPPAVPRETSMPFPPPAMPKEVFVHMGGDPEHYIAYLQEHQQLQARFMHRMHLQRQHSGLAQHAEGGAAFPAGLPPHLQPPPQAHSLEQVEAEQRQRQRQHEEAELHARLRQDTPPEQPPFRGGPFPPDLLPPHLRFPGPEQPPWPARPPFESPESQFQQEMLRRQHDHQQQLRRSLQGGENESRVQSELPPFLQGVLPRERMGGPEKEQSIPPELVAAVRDGRLPVEALAQYLTSLGIGGGEGGKNQGQEKPPAAKGSSEQGWTRAPILNFEHQAMREEPPLRMGPSIEEQGRMAAWAAMQKGSQSALMSQGSGTPQDFALLQGLVGQHDEKRIHAERIQAERIQAERIQAQRLEEERREKAHFEKLHQEHIAELRRQAQAQALQKPRGAQQPTAQQPPAAETGPWGGAQPEPHPMEVSLRDWVVEPEVPKAGPQVHRVPAQPAKEAPWTASVPKEKKSLLQIQVEEAERMAAERARHEAAEAARIAAGGYGVGQNGASPWGGNGSASRPKTMKEIQEEEARQAAERSARTNVVAGGPVWGPSLGQATPPVVNRPEKLQARDTLAEQVIQTAAVSAPQTPPAVSAKKRANETSPPVRTITAEEESEFVEAGSGKKSKKKGAKGKVAVATSKTAPAPTLMQSASPWAAEAAATRPSLRQLAAEVSADDTPSEYSSKSALGPSLADFLPGLHQEEKPQQGPAWNTGAGGAKRMTLKEIQEAERKEAERRAVAEKARQAAMPRPAQTQAPSGAPWQRPTPSNNFFPPAAAQPAPTPLPKAAPAPAPHAEDDDDLFWDYGKDATITIGNIPKEPEPPAYPSLGGPPKPQAGGNWATPKAAANAGYKQVASTANPGGRSSGQAGDFPTLAPTGAAATATGTKAKKKGAAALEPAAAPAFTPATAKAGADFRKWCQEWTRKITGQDDLTLLDFCMTLPSASDAGDYITEYWGSKPEVVAFQGEFLKRRSAMPASVLQADFFAGDASGDRPAEKVKATKAHAADASSDAQKATAAAEAAGKKKGKKGKKVVDNSLLGFSVHSSRINMGTIESAADAV